MGPTLLNRLRCLMAPEGDPPGSSGGGLAPGASGTTTLPQASGGAPAAAPQPVDIQSIVQQASQQARDSMFAALRKAGVLKEGREEPSKPTRGEPSASPSPDDKRLKLRAFDRAFSGSGAKLSDRAIERMERDFLAEDPADVAGWVKSYIEDFGGAGGGNRAGASSTPAGNATTNQTPAAGAEARPLVTNTPAPAGLPPGDIRDPYSLTEDDVQRLIRQHGMHGAGTKLLEAMRKVPKRRLSVRRR